MRRRKWQAVLFGAVLAGTLAACGSDGDDGGNGDNGGGQEQADGNGDNGGAEIGTGDPGASSVTFDGEELEVQDVTCAVVAVEDDALRVLADASGAEDTFGIAVNERTDGGHISITRSEDDSDFDGHTWYTPSGSEADTEIDAGGARGELELRWDTSSGNDEESESDAKDIAFDLACS